jgi:hypothetical protein
MSSNPKVCAARHNDDRDGLFRKVEFSLRQGAVRLPE